MNSLINNRIRFRESLHSKLSSARNLHTNLNWITISVDPLFSGLRIRLQGVNECRVERREIRKLRGKVINLLDEKVFFFSFHEL